MSTQGNESAGKRRAFPGPVMAAVAAIVVAALVWAVAARPWASGSVEVARLAAGPGASSNAAVSIDAQTLRKDIADWLKALGSEAGAPDSNVRELVTAITFEAGAPELYIPRPAEPVAILGGTDGISGWMSQDGNPYLRTYPKSDDPSPPPTPLLDPAALDVQVRYNTATRVLTFRTRGTHFILTGDATGLFADLPSLAVIDLSYVDTTEIYDMTGMFAGDTALASIRGVSMADGATTDVGFANKDAIDVSLLPSGSTLPPIRFTTENVTSMKDMFNGCIVLTSPDMDDPTTADDAKNEYARSERESTPLVADLSTWDIRNWNVEKVKDFSGMFEHCRGFQSIDLSEWENDVARDLNHMFAGMENVPVINIAQFNTRYVEDSSYMFWECTALRELVLSDSDGDVPPFVQGFNENIAGMFEGCENLPHVYTRDWDTSSVTTMRSLFQGCEVLQATGADQGEVDVSRWDVSSVTDMSGMFSRCHAFTWLDFVNEDEGTAWNTEQVALMDHMFEYCDHLTDIDLTVFSTTDTGSPREAEVVELDPDISGYYKVTSEYSYDKTADRWVVEIEEDDGTNPATTSTVTTSEMSITGVEITPANIASSATLNGTATVTVEEVPYTPAAPGPPATSAALAQRVTTAEVAVPEMSHMFRGCSKLVWLTLGADSSNIPEFRSTASGRATSADIPELCNVVRP